MAWTMNSSKPIYAQIIERVRLDIISGVYHPGDKLPSVRDLAQEAGVNPNTMQRALSELEQHGLVYSVRTSGRFITKDITMIEDMKKELATAQVKEFLNKMAQMGFDQQKTLELIANLPKEETIK